MVLGERAEARSVSPGLIPAAAGTGRAPRALALLRRAPALPAPDLLPQSAAGGRGQVTQTALQNTAPPRPHDQPPNAA